MKYRNRSDYSGYEHPVIDYPMTEPKYTYAVDPDTGKKIVKKIGETNVYLQKQEALQETLIYNLIEQYQRTGDASVFGENLGGFIDVTSMPRNLMEAENVRLQAESLFKSMPLEERAKYGQDVYAFLRDVNDKLKAKAASARQAAIKSVTEEEPSDEK